MSLVDILRADDAVTAFRRGPQGRRTLVDPAAPGWLHPAPPAFGRSEPTAGSRTGSEQPETRVDLPGRADTGATS
ncbi:hypothetical protein [Nocardioides litoris]|uniref:hypothetical protein n=1 Tax=Nocardioides litoris TaxID=1926648 RepID=UPI001123FC4A|nr:hypothetical protein [Nocardioides litoris]